MIDYLTKLTLTDRYVNLIIADLKTKKENIDSFCRIIKSIKKIFQLHIENEFLFSFNLMREIS
jgi:hypothetical protein